jgi:transcriptional regulator with XRE-family HTH domain
LPAWESSPPGYVLRLDREEAGLTQAALAKKLGCSQQAVAQAERWTSNPTVEFVRRWRKACGERRPLENFVAESGRYGNSESGKPFRLDPDLALRFKTSTAVNRALRELISERARERRSKMRSKTR